jgi:hypothetical protein
MKPITIASSLIAVAILIGTASCVFHRNKKATVSSAPIKPPEDKPIVSPKSEPEKALANCEIHGLIKFSGEDSPVENVMVFAIYRVDKYFKCDKIAEVVGPILTDDHGKFIIPAFWMDKTYFVNYHQGSCTGTLVFIHPNFGAFSTTVCRDEFPPEEPFKALDLVQYQNGEHLRNNNIKDSYEEINQLPPEQRAIAWNHVSPSFKTGSESK